VPSAEWRANPRLRLRGRLAFALKEFPRLRRFVLSRWNLAISAASAFSWRPTPRVVLSEHQRQAIVSRLEGSNRGLARTFRLDLDEAGYW
jgi:hypothetical protein